MIDENTATTSQEDTSAMVDGEVAVVEGVVAEDTMLHSFWKDMVYFSMPATAPLTSAS